MPDNNTATDPPDLVEDALFHDRRDNAATVQVVIKQGVSLTDLTSWDGAAKTMAFTENVDLDVWTGHASDPAPTAVNAALCEYYQAVVFFGNFNDTITLYPGGDASNPDDDCAGEPSRWPDPPDSTWEGEPAYNVSACFAAEQAIVVD